MMVGKNPLNLSILSYLISALDLFLSLFLYLARFDRGGVMEMFELDDGILEACTYISAFLFFPLLRNFVKLRRRS